MELQLVRHLWGVPLAPGFAHYVPGWRKFGYTAVETPLRGLPDRAAFLRDLKASGMGWIPQVFSRGFAPGGSVREHIDSLREQVDEVAGYGPLFINSHSGADTWSAAEATEFFGLALELEKRAGIVIAHETHRMRYLGTPWRTHEILNAFPALRLTCDFSHWVCVCERLLPDLGDTLALAARHCHHVHARVGFEQGPQVPDPSAPEYATHLAAHEAWWDAIWASQRERGVKVSTLTPEFGPAAYMPLLPHTRQPVADLATICDWMAARQRARFPAI